MNKLRSEFEATPEIKVHLDHGNVFWSDKNQTYASEFQCLHPVACYVNGAWFMFREKAKAQAVPEGRTDIEIIKQTIGLVDLIAKANRFERNKSSALPFESQNPRVKEWWDLACEIQDLLTQTDPNNCDFEEYKDLVASESGAEG